MRNNTETKVEVTYIKGATLEWVNIWSDLNMTKDNGGRWYPSDRTPDYVVEFLKGYRSPSRAFPFSYAKPLLTQKFAKYLCIHDSDLAIRLGVAS